MKQGTRPYVENLDELAREVDEWRRLGPDFALSPGEVLALIDELRVLRARRDLAHAAAAKLARAQGEARAARDWAEQAERALRQERDAHDATRLVVAGLADALYFYADEKTWSNQVDDRGALLPSSAERDRGARAIKALRLRGER